MKRFIAVLVSLCMAFTLVSVPVSATQETMSLPTEYIVFREGDSTERIDQNGFFDFSIRYYVESAPFSFDSTSSNVAVHATCDNPNETVRISIIEYTDSLFGYNKSFTFSADGQDYTHRFTGLDPDKRYYLTISKANNNTLVTGMGYIPNYVG